MLNIVQYFIEFHPNFIKDKRSRKHAYSFTKAWSYCWMQNNVRASFD